MRSLAGITAIAAFTTRSNRVSVRRKAKEKGVTSRREKSATCTLFK